MNGIHDMGGMQDMGPIQPAKDEPVFHAPWEGRAFAMWIAVPADWGYGAERYQKELIPPADYLRMNYYDKITTGLVELLVKTKVVTQDEINSGKPGAPAGKVPKMLKAAEVAPMIAAGFPSSRHVAATARFHAGQRVRGRNINPVGHTRLPRYARGKVGTIERDCGVYVFPDSDALGLGEKPQHVYSVRFGARELWGDEANRRDSVYVAMWDDYLEPA
ncbi:MAG TPA: nitrile hydratase subunit beta [Steroidobacteraceae bacterium]|nr:nitrile hydratase subunit beta [Steroidobacteraceae bacterium]